VFSAVFIAKEVDGVGDKGAEDITTVYVHTLSDPLEYATKIYLFQ
jgi:hypothetical protein